MWANENLLKSVGLSSINDIINKNDYHFPWNDFAEKYRADDQHTLDVKKALCFEEYHKDISGRITLANVTKKPLYDEHGDVIGIIGSYSKTPLNISPVNQTALTKRQKEVLKLVANGLTAKQIAIRLGISQRTVEFYLEIIKSKLDCQNKAQLIRRAVSLGYL